MFFLDPLEIALPGLRVPSAAAFAGADDGGGGVGGDVKWSIMLKNGILVRGVGDDDETETDCPVFI